MAAKAKRLELEVGGRELSISNPDKVLFSDDGITKAEMVRYYERSAPLLVSTPGGGRSPCTASPTASARAGSSRSRSGSTSPNGSPGSSSPPGTAAPSSSSSRTRPASSTWRARACSSSTRCSAGPTIRTAPSRSWSTSIRPPPTGDRSERPPGACGSCSPTVASPRGEVQRLPGPARRGRRRSPRLRGSPGPGQAVSRPARRRGPDRRPLAFFQRTAATGSARASTATPTSSTPRRRTRWGAAWRPVGRRSSGTRRLPAVGPAALDDQQPLPSPHPHDDPWSWPTQIGRSPVAAFVVPKSLSTAIVRWAMRVWWIVGTVGESGPAGVLGRARERGCRWVAERPVRCRWPGR